jgi:hypothetical protein
VKTLDILKTGFVAGVLTSSIYHSHGVERMPADVDYANPIEVHRVTEQADELLYESLFLGAGVGSSAIAILLLTAGRRRVIPQPQQTSEVA